MRAGSALQANALGSRSACSASCVLSLLFVNNFFDVSSCNPPPPLPSRRLARKAESARQARLRHKQFVTDLQDQAAGLQARISELETHCTSGPGSASVALRELKGALSEDQLGQLRKWCVASSTAGRAAACRWPGSLSLPRADQSCVACIFSPRRS